MTFRTMPLALFLVCCGCASAHATPTTESANSWATSRYDLDGRAPWKPIRAFNVGERTYIDFPAAVHIAALPVLFVEQADGDPPVVNYHYDSERCRMRVDAVIDRASLVAGVGRNQMRIQIRRAVTRAPEAWGGDHYAN